MAQGLLRLFGEHSQVLLRDDLNCVLLRLDRGGGLELEGVFEETDLLAGDLAAAGLLADAFKRVQVEPIRQVQFSRVRREVCGLLGDNDLNSACLLFLLLVRGLQLLRLCCKIV